MQTTMKSAKRILAMLLVFALVVGTAVGFAPSINNSEVYATALQAQSVIDGITWDTIKGSNTSESNVSSNLALPTDDGYSHSIYWTSSDTRVITTAGAVMGNLLEDSNVTLTASVEIDGTSASKTFDVTVKQYTESAGVVNVYVTLAKDGTLAKDKSGKEIAQTMVSAKDSNGDGNIDVDDVLYYAHKALRSESEYASAVGRYGLGVTRLLGVDGTSFGYYVNDVSSWSAADQVSDGDYLTAFVYKDLVAFSDKYAKFSQRTYSATAGSNVELSLTKEGYEYVQDGAGNWNSEFVSGPAEGAKIKVIGDTTNANNGKVVDANGKCTLNFAAAGTYLIVAEGPSAPIVPAITTVEVEGINVYVTLAKDGTLAKDNAGKEIAQTPVTVLDRNHDGYDVDDVLYYAHKTLRAESEYASEQKQGYTGLSLTKLLGEENKGFGYRVNDVESWSASDPVADGDYLTAFVYKDQTGWSDKYAKFSQNTYTATVGNSFDVTLTDEHYEYRYDGEGNYLGSDLITGPSAGAKIKVIGDTNNANNGKVVDANGKCTLNFATAGTYLIVAEDPSAPIVPAVAKITVTGKSSGGSGGGGGAAATTTTETTQTTATTATTEVETKATVADGKATASVTADDVNKAIENVNKQAATEKASEKEVVLEVKSEGKVDSVQATIPASATKELAKAEANVVLKTDCGNVEIPADTMDSISTQAAGQDLSVAVENKKAEDVITNDVSEKIKQETGLEKAALDGASIVDVTIKAGDTEITSFGGGKVKLSLPVVGKQIVGKLYKVLAISANGALDMLTGKCSMKDGAKVMDVDSTHLTTFVLTTEEVKNPFSDVKEGDYFYSPVLWAVEKNVTSGKTEDTFAPYEGCTRAQMVTFLWRAAGSPWASANRHFSDVADNAYYKDAVEWAIAAGITNGISDTKFNPNGSVTREQLAAFIYRYAQSMGKGFTGSWMFLLDYDDASQVSQWADEAMHWCVMNNIVTGTTARTLSPAGEANRAQIVTMLYRYFNL